MSNWKIETIAHELSDRLESKIDEKQLQKVTDLSIYQLAYLVLYYFKPNDFNGNLRFDFYLKACVYYYLEHVLLEKLYEKLDTDERVQKNINDPNFIFVSQHRCLEDKLITKKNYIISDFLTISNKSGNKQYYVCISGVLPKHSICNFNFEDWVKKYIQTNTVYFNIFDANSDKVWYNIPAQDIYKKVKELL